MTVRDILGEARLQRPTVSFELFPPRTVETQNALWSTVNELATASPDFVSVTYGANGSTRTSSRSVVRRLITETKLLPVAHLTCVEATRDEVTAVIDEFLDEGVRDFLALRGDPPAGVTDWQPQPDGLRYASELVTHLRDVADRRGIAPDQISIGVAAFPALHAAPGGKQQGLDVLATKQAAGADFALTQVFFDPENYLALVDDARDAGITIPIVPGVIPLTTPRRAHRIAELTKVPLPQHLVSSLERADGEAAQYRAGVAAARELALEILEGGAPGLHVYTFNKHAAALDLLASLGLHRQNGTRSTELNPTGHDQHGPTTHHDE